jgi:hypothetical protein
MLWILERGNTSRTSTFIDKVSLILLDLKGFQNNTHIKNYQRDKNPFLAAFVRMPIYRLYAFLFYVILMTAGGLSHIRTQKECNFV